VFSSGSDDAHYACTDGWAGPLITVRFNKIFNCWIEVHGTDTTGRLRTAAGLFVYNNEFIALPTFGGGTGGPCSGSCNVGTNHRGGAAHVFRNSFDSDGTGYPSNLEVQLHAERFDGGISTVWGLCDGTNMWDNNTGGTPNHCLDQACWGAGSLISGDPLNAPPWTDGENDQVLNVCYGWGNTREGGAITLLKDASTHDAGTILNANVDFFNIGAGNISTTVPGSCSTLNEGYVDTDGANWNTRTGGGDDVLYRCNGSVYVEHLTPPNYPHLLSDDGGSADVTDPEVIITAPTSGATFSTGVSPLTTLAGTCSDDVAVSSVSWSSNRGGSGAATGTTTWSVASITLQAGDNVLTVTCTDSSSNTHEDALTVSFGAAPYSINMRRIRRP
jgi:hypothetical protein